MYLVLKWKISYHLCFHHWYILHHTCHIHCQIHGHQYHQFLLHLHSPQVTDYHFHNLYIYTSHYMNTNSFAVTLVVYALWLLWQLQVTNSKIDSGASFPLVYLISGLPFSFFQSWIDLCTAPVNVLIPVIPPAPFCSLLIVCSVTWSEESILSVPLVFLTVKWPFKNSWERFGWVESGFCWLVQ